MLEIGNIKFPPLHLALVIESRFNLRRDIAHLIRSLLMFEDVIEAKSVSDGYGIVDLRAVDCCILGVGLNETSASAFADRGKNSAMSKDCAFIKLVAREEQLQETESFDIILEMPTTKAKLAEAVIRGVLSANKNSPWSGILLNSGLTEDQFIVMLTKEGALKVGEKVSDLTDSLTHSGVRRKATRTLAAILQDVTDEKIARIDDDRFKILQQQIVSQLVVTTGISDDVLQKLVGEWLSDRRTLSHQQSLKILERKLAKLVG
jgi:hypothetical protein